MAQKVCATALVACSSGQAPIPITVLPGRNTMTTMPTATIFDCTAANMPSFGFCLTTLSPCVPCAPTWLPLAPTVAISNQPALVQGSQAICPRGGVISIIEPGQFTVTAG